MDISIIIPNYNGEKLLKNNLPRVLDAVKEYSHGNMEIIVADDASSDDSIKVVEEFFLSIKEKHISGIIVKNTNREDGGFSKNVNRGTKRATGDILLLLNTDVVPRKGFLTPLLKHFEDTKVFAVGCMDESIEDGKTVLRGRGIGKWEKGFMLHSAGILDKETTLWVSGGSGAFRKSIWDTLGGFNELYNPFYWEDIDLSYRAQKAGFTTLFEKESKVIHEHSKGAIKTNFTNKNIEKVAYRNQFLFVWLNITDRGLLLSHIAWLPIHIAHAIKAGNSTFIYGCIEACLRLPRVVMYKKKVKKLFIVSDKEILQRFSQDK